MNIIGKRYLFFALSLIIIVPGLLILAINGLPLSLDFTGGSLLEIKLASGDVPEPAQVVSIYTLQGINDAQVQTTSSDTLIIRSSFIEDSSRETIINAMEEEFGSTVNVVRLDSVGPTIGAQVASRAALAVAVAALVVVAYITWAFRGVEHAFRYGVSAIIAMIHDVLIVFSVVGIGSVVAGWEMDALFLTALLTVIGFSVQDKIVVFDRIRENSRLLRKLEFEKLVNHSIVQTLQRSINTQLMTVEFLLLALAMFGGITLREFSVILLVGLLERYLFFHLHAAAILVVWGEQGMANWFGRERTKRKHQPLYNY
jgi:preprotein translocase subunit SecF